MNLSQSSLDALLEMPQRDKIGFLMDETFDTGDFCEYALLLGAPLDEAERRALHAAELYRQGRIRSIISSGGVERNRDGEQISECDFMARVLEENGVPKSAVIRENQARSTIENMLLGALVLHHATELVDVDKIMIITSKWHMKRSLALAESFLPRKLSVCGSPAPLEKDDDEWINSEEHMSLINTEIRILKALVDQRIIPDMEFGV